MALLIVASAVEAQGSELQLFLNRDWGFSLGNQIQGSFTLAVSGPVDITSVTFLIDGKAMATVNQAPFRFSFSTDSYSLGRHRFSATARTAGGPALESNVIDAEIVTPSTGLQSATRILVPIFGALLVIIIVMVAAQVLPLGRNKRRYDPGAVINYGVAGGAICPQCGRPFARSLFALNLLTGKLERCPYCGKWSLTRPASTEALRAAEQAQVQDARPVVQEKTPEEQLLQQIEESRMAR